MMDLNQTSTKGRRTLRRFRDTPPTAPTLFAWGYRKLHDGRWVFIREQETEFEAFEISDAFMARVVGSIPAVKEWDRSLAENAVRLRLAWMVLSAVFGIFFFWIAGNPVFEGARGGDLPPTVEFWFGSSALWKFVGVAVVALAGLLMVDPIAAWLAGSLPELRPGRDDIKPVDLVSYVRRVPKRGVVVTSAMTILIGLLMFFYGLGCLMSVHVDFVPLVLKADLFTIDATTGLFIGGFGLLIILTGGWGPFNLWRKASSVYVPEWDFESMCDVQFFQEVGDPVPSIKATSFRLRYLGRKMFAFSGYALWAAMVVMYLFAVNHLDPEDEGAASTSKIELIDHEAAADPAPTADEVLAAFTEAIGATEGTASHGRLTRWDGTLRATVIRAERDEVVLLDDLAAYLLVLQDATGLTADLAPVDSKDAPLVVRLVESSPSGRPGIAKLALRSTRGAIGKGTLTIWLPRLRYIAVKRAEAERPETHGEKNRDWDLVNEHLDVLTSFVACRGVLEILGVKGRRPTDAELNGVLPREPCVLSARDRGMLSVLFDPRIMPGMSRGAAVETARTIMDETFSRAGSNR